MGDANLTQDQIERSRRRDKEIAAWEAQYRTASGVAPRFHNKMFCSFKVTTPGHRTAVDAVDDMVDAVLEERVPAALWLVGPPGTGKTHLVSALVTELWINWGKECYLATPTQLVRRLRETWNRGAKRSEGEVLQEIAGLDLLVIDDVGAGRDSQGELVQIAEVIDLRWSHGKPIVITTNLDVDALAAELGPRTIDRLRDGARVVALTGESYRRPKRGGEAANEPRQLVNSTPSAAGAGGRAQTEGAANLATPERREARA